MITWHEELPFDFSSAVVRRFFTEDAIFFDIETTGFSPAHSNLYLIWLRHPKGRSAVHRSILRGRHG